ncbi:MAG: leucyl/phenylalanyl-tRNA--protein transferase [Pseudomonadota bacterium]
MSRGFGPEQLLDCYRRGVFPMADDRDDPRLFLVDPDCRGVIPLDDFHLPRSLKKSILKDRFEVRVDTAFTSVVEACASPAPGRESTWINSPIVNLYSALHRKGYAHSVECWDGEDLVGGLYGVSLRGAFFGESMFSRATDASKTALAHLVARLKFGGYQLLDTQFVTDHLKRFGATEISRDAFKVKLGRALAHSAEFSAAPSIMSGTTVVQLITQTS